MNKENKPKSEYPVFQISADRRGFPAFDVYKSADAKPELMTAQEVLALPKYKKPEAAKELAVMLNHYFYQYEYSVILDIAEFTEKIKKKFAAEDPKKPFNPHQQQLRNFGMPDLDGIKNPSFDGKVLTYYVSSGFLASFPYKAEVELNGTLIGDAKYSPVGTVSTDDQGKPLASAPKKSNEIKAKKGEPQKLEYSGGERDEGLVKVDGGEAFPAKDLLKHYPDLFNKKNAAGLALWIMNYGKYHKKSKYYWVIVEDKEDIKNRMNKLLSQYEPFASSVKDKEPRKLGIRFGYQSILDYRKINFDLVEPPQLDGDTLKFWTRERDEAIEVKGEPSERSLRQCINYLMGAKYNEVTIVDGEKVQWESFQFNELMHQRSKEPLTLTYNMDKNGWPSFKLTRAGFDIYIVTSKKLVLYPEIIQEKYAKELASLINHTEHSKDYVVIDDPREYEKKYRSDHEKEDPNARFEGQFRLRDYAMPDFSKMIAPRLKDGELTFFVYRKHQKKPPYHVRATLTKAGKVDDVKYTRIDML